MQLCNHLALTVPHRAPETDHEVRWCLLKLADLLIRGAEEAPPKVTIHLPPTPVTEVAPPIPPVKLKTRPSIKTGGPPTRTPTLPFASTQKLKLPPSGVQGDVSSRAPSAAASPVLDKRDTFSVPKLPPPKKAPVPEKKKPQNIPKAQAAGMSLNDLRACRNALKKLQTHKRAAVFLQPVDPVRDHAPRYAFCPKLPSVLLI